MQRMGDLVLSYPLLARLSVLFPGHPVWVVGERHFYEPLLPLSPRVTYFEYDAAPGLETQAFHLVINLSHRPEAAALAGRLQALETIGPAMDGNGRLFIRGNWQIYRSSLTDNNRYNLFHWADLNCLDLANPYTMLRTVWPKVLAPQAQQARIGLFLGASQQEKHPDAHFWAGLCSRLLAMGHRPVLLGGKNELPLGASVASSLGSPSLNLCGRFTVGELAEFFTQLDLLITPDTGPMHVAAWLGVACLNLSLGPVNAWETGPTAPGHFVLRANLDCVGCWQCTQPEQKCRKAMTDARVTSVARAILDGDTKRLARPWPGLVLSQTHRDTHGLYTLVDCAPPPEAAYQERMALSRFWQSWFAAQFGYLKKENAQQAATSLRHAQPEKAAHLAASAALFARDVAKDAAGGRFCLVDNPDAWRNSSPLLHPFSGYAQMLAQNELGSPVVRTRLIEMAEQLAAGLSG